MGWGSWPRAGLLVGHVQMYNYLPADWTSGQSTTRAVTTSRRQTHMDTHTYTSLVRIQEPCTLV